MGRRGSCLVLVGLVLLAACGGSSTDIAIDAGPDAVDVDGASDGRVPNEFDVSFDVVPPDVQELDVVADPGPAEVENGQDLGPDDAAEQADQADVPQPGEFGSQCEANTDCYSGYCLIIATGHVCTITCLEECPGGWQCLLVQGLGPDPVSVCAPFTPCDDPTAEVCDGVDNDCNGETDDDLGVVTCGLGECAHEVPVCVDGQLQTCDPLEGAVEEVCDGMDNDCDGLTDEEFPDLDQDLVPDCLDPDKDGDGIANEQDNCPVTSNADQADLDGDLIGDACDPDADGDAIPDEVDNCPGLKNTSQSDIDEDGLGDACDPDIDGDGILNELDNCPMVPNTWQTDTDGDGVGDDCEKDKDGDGVDDPQDCQPLDPTVYPGANEVCDGVDNDCNAGVDDGFKDTDFDGVKDCVDLDDDDDGTPDDGDCAPLDPGIHPGVPEKCDGVDNDCDGEVDEGLGSETCGLGECAHTVALCVEGKEQACNPLAGVAPEVCDSLDNDCDGLTDEDLGWKMCGIGVCQQILYACEGGKEVVCDPFKGMGPEVCDGLDNDCDGQLDEGLGSTTCGLGACTHTIANCFGGLPQECNPLAGEKPEACDLIDNDCDGQIDEELGTSDCGLGACQHAVANCVAGQPQVCNPLEGAAVEACDGLDNDCDGQVDEGLGNETCGKGVCTHSVEKCKDGKTQVCDPFAGAAEEACDGLDNDCDGLVDEALGSTVCGVGGCEHLVANCLDGAPEPCDPLAGAKSESCDGQDNDCDGEVDEGLGQTACGIGDCLHTVPNCLAGLPQLCNPLEGMQQEKCDGKDNDCDGEADEGLGQTACGIGACKHMVANCLDAAPEPCDPLAGAKPEVCDGQDNDCDGQLDEDCPLASCKVLHEIKPGLGSGSYQIDPDGVGGLEPVTVWCDMETAGGGWTTAFDDTGTWQTVQSIPAAVKGLGITELLLYSTTSGPVVQAISPGLASLAAAFAQAWAFCGFENDYYKPLGKSTGTKTTTAYIFDDHDIAGTSGAGHYTCSGHQVGYPTTPAGLISFAYANGNNFCDGGSCDYGTYAGTAIRKMLVR